MRKILLSCCCLLLLSSLAYAGEIRDDFEDGNPNGWKEVAGDWEIQDGAYVQLGAGMDPINDAPRTIIQSPWDFDNGTIEVTIEFDKNSGGTEEPCILYRMVDDDNGYVFRLRSTHLEVGRLVAGQFESIRGDAYPVEIGDPIKIKLVVEGIITKVYYNGILTNRVGDPNDKGDEKGKIGLAVLSPGQPIYFDDLVISGNSVAPFPAFGEQAVESVGKLASAWGKMKMGL